MRDQPTVLKALMRGVERSEDAALVCVAEESNAFGLCILHVNTAFERMTGYGAEAITGLSLRIFEGAKTDPQVLSRIHRALSDGVPIRQELVNYRKDGSEFLAEHSLMPLADTQGGYTYWFVLVRDLTEMHRLRRELRTSNALLRTMTESVPQLLWTANADGQREWVSDRFAEFVGADVADCLGDQWVRYVHPDDQEIALARLQAFRQQRKVCTAELRLRHYSGEYRWFLKQAAPRFAADGSVSKWIGSFTDISDRKAAELALQRSEERLRLGVAAAKLGLAEIDYATGMNHLSAEASALLGFGKEAIVVPREAIHGVFHPEDLAQFQVWLAECLRGLEQDWFEMDHRVVWPGGEVRWVHIRTQVTFEWDGDRRRPLRAMMVIFDITLSKETEAAMRESERRLRELAKQSFL